ncbi:30S ribosomal protein S4, partial [Striga asiatica]
CVPATRSFRLNPICKVDSSVEIPSKKSSLSALEMLKSSAATQKELTLTCLIYPRSRIDIEKLTPLPEDRAFDNPTFHAADPVPSWRLNLPAALTLRARVRVCRPFLLLLLRLLGLRREVAAGGCPLWIWAFGASAGFVVRRSRWGFGAWYLASLCSSVGLASRHRLSVKGVVRSAKGCGIGSGGVRRLLEEVGASCSLSPCILVPMVPGLRKLIVVVERTVGSDFSDISVVVAQGRLQFFGPG